MRLAFIHPFFFRLSRGIERYTVQLASALARSGNEVSILTWSWKPPINWPGLDHSVHVHAFPVGRYFAAKTAVPFYSGHLQRSRYDHVILHFADYGEAGTIHLLRRLGREIPYSIVLHFPYSQVPLRYESFVRSGLASGAREIIAVSSFVAGEAKAVFSRECKVISHGVDQEIFKPDAAVRSLFRKQLGLSNNAPVLLSVAALEERKGIQWMLKALPEVLSVEPETVYLVVGAGAYESVLRELARNLKIESQVRFEGATHAVARYYQCADIKVILSKGEASSMVALEALASGVPVLTSCHPPFDELIRPEWGLQVDETNPDQIADQVVKLIQNPLLRRSLGDAGRAHVLADHSWSAIADQYLQVLRGDRLPEAESR